MKILKRIIAGFVITAILAGAAAGGIFYLKKSNQKEILVVGVENLASDYYMQDTNLEGTITTSVSQNVSVDEDMIIEDVYINKGDVVKVGDKLISFDMTLVEMELNIAKLKRQQQVQNLDKAVNRLTSLKNGGPIVETSGGFGADDLGGMDDMEDMMSFAGETNGSYLAAVMHPLLALAVNTGAEDANEEVSVNEEANAKEGANDVAAASLDVDQAAPNQEIPAAEPEQTPEIQQTPAVEPTQAPVQEQIPEQIPESIPTPAPSDGDLVKDQIDSNGGNVDNIVNGSGDFSSGDGFSSGTEEYTPDQMQTPAPMPGEEVDIIDPDLPEAEGISDGNPMFYQILTSKTEPFEGTGTEEDPYIFLCSGAKSKVIVDGSFLNVMAGFSEDGSQILKEGGYWYQLEFHKDDTITNFLNRKESCIGYYLINGSVLESPLGMTIEKEFTLADASTYEPEIPDDDYLGGGFDIPSGDYGSGLDSSISREDAIKMKESEIASLKLDIQESDINIGKLERKINKKVIYSKLDGIVSYVGDPLTGMSDGDAFLSIRSKEGYYVSGIVSELLLEQIEEGTILGCSSYESGNFEAEVVDISDFPISSDSYYGYGSSNPNVSYYTFSATISDKTLSLSDQDWLTITLQAESSDENVIVLSKAFVRSENGINYVYKDDNGVLKRQNLAVGATVDGGYSILIKGGITKADKIAFPYGEDVVEGAKTREGTLDEMYGY